MAGPSNQTETDFLSIRIEFLLPRPFQPFVVEGSCSSKAIVSDNPEAQPHQDSTQSFKKSRTLLESEDLDASAQDQGSNVSQGPEPSSSPLTTQFSSQLTSSVATSQLSNQDPPDHRTPEENDDDDSQGPEDGDYVPNSPASDHKSSSQDDWDFEEDQEAEIPVVSEIH